MSAYAYQDGVSLVLADSNISAASVWGVGMSGIERWPGKSAQDDKWSFCLNAAMIAAEQERL